LFPRSRKLIPPSSGNTEGCGNGCLVIDTSLSLLSVCSARSLYQIYRMNDEKKAAPPESPAMRLIHETGNDQMR
ncbi:hypothetical protein ACV35G_31830, partial [Pseudomonas aeruginosa]